MYTLTYESRAVKPLTGGQLGELLEKAIAKNELLGITGCLIYYEANFVQILEGEKGRVEELFYHSIKPDERHTDVHIFSKDTIEKRTFPNWGMAFYPVDEKVMTSTEMEQFKRNLRLLADLSNPTNITAMLFWKWVRSMIS